MDSPRPMITRVQIRNQIKLILIRRLRIPPSTGDSNATHLRRLRIRAIKQLTIRIESSLYRRAMNMEWYSDLRMLEWRVVRIAHEMLTKRSGRSELHHLLESR
eukprot:scaffold8367_cov91-Cyclotella_meneghiniana.AAC.5